MIEVVNFSLISQFWSVFNSLIVLLNPDFNCSKKLLSSFVDKVTTGTYNFVSVILNVAPIGLLILDIAGFPLWARTASLVALLVNTHLSDHVKIRFVSQLINGMSNVLQKLLKYFKSTTISTSFSVLLFSNFPVILVL